MTRVASALLFALASPNVAAQQPSIVGTWEWTRKANSCAEQYVFRDDGTASIRSGDERIETKYLLAWSPEANGRYKLTMTPVKDSGGRGCADTVEAGTARQAMLYVLFGGSRATMIICHSEAGADCIGPLKKAQ